MPCLAAAGESLARVGVLDEYDRPPWANATRELVDTGDCARSIVARRRSGEAAVLHVDDQQGDHGDFSSTWLRRMYISLNGYMIEGLIVIIVNKEQANEDVLPILSYKRSLLSQNK